MRIRRTVFALLCLVASGTLAARESHLRFSPDEAAASRAAGDARELVRFAGDALCTRLDWSEASLHAVDELAGSLHADLRRRRAKPADVAPLVAMIGSYVGEVLRRERGGDWGWLLAGGRPVLAFRPAGGAPVALAAATRRRVLQGAGGSLWRVYRGASLQRARLHAESAPRVAPLADISAISPAP